MAKSSQYPRAPGPGLFSLTVESDKVEATINRIRQTLPRREKKAVRFVANQMLKASKKIVPVDKGTLRRSGKVELASAEGGEVTFRIDYGGPGSGAEAYAVAVHEHMSSASPPSWHGKKIKWTKPGTGPKFLEKVVFKDKRKYRRDLKDVLDLEGLAKAAKRG